MSRKDRWSVVVTVLLFAAIVAFGGWGLSRSGSVSDPTISGDRRAANTDNDVFVRLVNGSQVPVYVGATNVAAWAWYSPRPSDPSPVGLDRTTLDPGQTVTVRLAGKWSATVYRQKVYQVFTLQTNPRAGSSQGAAIPFYSKTTEWTPCAGCNGYDIWVWPTDEVQANQYSRCQGTWSAPAGTYTFRGNSGGITATVSCAKFGTNNTETIITFTDTPT